MRELDLIDCKILDILQNNCRESLTDIARKVDLSIDSVKKRITKLMEKKVYHPKIQLRPPHFGFPNVVEVKIKLNTHDKDVFQKFIAYLQENPRVVEIFKISGRWDISIVIISKNAQDFRDVSMKIKEQFGTIISDWVESMTLDSYKFEKYDLVKLLEETSPSSSIVIIDYGLGNVSSVLNALTVLGHKAEITRDKDKIRAADKIILPGVGAFEEGMNNLKEFDLINILYEEVIIKKKPFLGICLGMQLICNKSFEGGEFPGLGWIDAEVIRFNNNVRVPHIGWNDISCNTNSPLFKDGNEKQTFYFVHSFYVNLKDPSLDIGTCNYGLSFPAVIQKENIFATQFHPEKSQHEGLELLRKFAELKYVKKETNSLSVS